MMNYETNSLVLQMTAKWMIGEFRRVHSSTTTAQWALSERLWYWLLNAPIVRAGRASLII